jgi:hypothetical protein
VKMILRECSNVAEAIDRQIIIQMRIDILKYLAESRAIGVNSRLIQ